MGLFDRLSGDSSNSLTPRAALALAVMVVIGADGSIDDEEIDSLRRVVRDDNNAFDLAYRAYKAKSVSDCIALVTQSLDRNQRACAMANILDVAMADGILADSEKRALEVFVEQFDLPENALKSMVDIISIKNDYSVF